MLFFECLQDVKHLRRLDDDAAIIAELNCFSSMETNYFNRTE